MADRPKAIRRLVAVQQQMVRLCELKVAQADRARNEIFESQERLQGYVVESGALGVPLARAALRSLHGLDERLAEAERQREAGKAALQTAKQRERAAGDLLDRVDRAARRAAEDRELGLVVETWLAASGTSLP